MKRKVITLLDPNICLKCRFRKDISLLNQDGNIDVFVLCSRKDCDNFIWNTLTEIEITSKESNE
jgi:hypothetical protein